MPTVGASDPTHLRSMRCQAARRAAAAAALWFLGSPVPCAFHQGPTRPAWQGHCLGSGSGALGFWALTQLPAMQGEVSGPPFRQSREVLPPSSRPLGVGPRCPHRYPQAQDPAIRQVSSIYANYVKYATLGTPMGSLCPSSIGRWAPSSSWSQAA